MTSEEAKKAVLNFYDVAFVQRKPDVAAAELMGDSYKQHNPDVPDGKDAFVGAIGGMFGAFPDFSSEIKRVIAEGDQVVIHHHVRMTAAPEDRGMSVIDIFKVDGNGKIIEHWDVLQPVPETPANENTMF